MATKASERAQVRVEHTCCSCMERLRVLARPERAPRPGRGPNGDMFWEIIREPEVDPSREWTLDEAVEQARQTQGMWAALRPDLKGLADRFQGLAEELDISVVWEG